MRVHDRVYREIKMKPLDHEIELVSFLKFTAIRVLTEILITLDDDLSTLEAYEYALNMVTIKSNMISRELICYIHFKRFADKINEFNHLLGEFCEKFDELFKLYSGSSSFYFQPEDNTHGRIAAD